MPPLPPPSLWAVIPVKPLHAGKTRLAHLLTAEQRAALIRQFLTQTLCALADVTSLTGTLVISSDGEVLHLAQNFGAQTLPEASPQGLNVAVTQGTAQVLRCGATGVLILPADLPFVQATDIALLCQGVVGNGRSLSICADTRQEGTNALLLHPPTGFRYQYGPGSYARHLSEAARLGLTCYRIATPGLQFDLDTEQDWLHYTQLTLIHNPQFTIHNS